MGLNSLETANYQSYYHIDFTGGIMADRDVDFGEGVDSNIVREGIGVDERRLADGPKHEPLLQSGEGVVGSQIAEVSDPFEPAPSPYSAEGVGVYRFGPDSSKNDKPASSGS